MKNRLGLANRRTAVLSGAAAAITGSGALINVFGRGVTVHAIQGFVVGLAATLSFGSLYLARRGSGCASEGGCD